MAGTFAIRHSPFADLDSLVRRVDEDRWLASRFAPGPARRRLVALYALNYEIAHTAETVTQPALGDMRLAWWREAVEEVFSASSRRAHPALQAFGVAVRETGLSKATLDALIDARGKDLDAEPFASWSDVEAYLEATAGGVLRLAAEVCEARASDQIVRQAALAWGCLGLARAEPYWRTRGRSVFPRGVGADEMLARSREAYGQIRGVSVAPGLTPALAYVSLTPMYVRGSAQGRREAPLILRQLRLIRTVLTGRL